MLRMPRGDQRVGALKAELKLLARSQRGNE